MNEEEDSAARVGDVLLIKVVKIGAMALGAPILLVLGGWATSEAFENREYRRSIGFTKKEASEVVQVIEEKLQKSPPEEWKRRVENLERKQEVLLEQQTQILLQIQNVKTILDRIDKRM